MREVGTEATVIEVLERFDDGRLNIVVEGGDRFRVVELTHGRSFSTAEVDVLPDESEAASPADVERCLAAYRRVVAAADAELDELDPERESIAYQIAARVDFGVEIKQDLLELRSERDRVRRLAGLLDRAAEAVRRERDIRERASSNGRVDAA